MTRRDPLDPKGLIREAYLIEGISAPECRSIFLDWALSYEGNPQDGLSTLLERHSAEPEDHPMTLTLREGLAAPNAPERRGGRRGRVPQ